MARQIPPCHTHTNFTSKLVRGNNTAMITSTTRRRDGELCKTEDMDDLQTIQPKLLGCSIVSAYARLPSQQARLHLGSWSMTKARNRFCSLSGCTKL